MKCEVELSGGRCINQAEFLLKWNRTDMTLYVCGEHTGEPTRYEIIHLKQEVA